MYTDADRRIAELAVRQHHVFTRVQEAAGELNRFPLVPPGLVVVSRPDSRPNRSDLAEVRRLVDFRSEDHIVMDGIPTTSPLRTAADLAGSSAPGATSR